MFHRGTELASKNSEWVEKWSGTDQQSYDGEEFTNLLEQHDDKLTGEPEGECLLHHIDHMHPADKGQTPMWPYATTSVGDPPWQTADLRKTDTHSHRSGREEEQGCNSSLMDPTESNYQQEFLYTDSSSHGMSPERPGNHDCNLQSSSDCMSPIAQGSELPGSPKFGPSYTPPRQRANSLSQFSELETSTVFSHGSYRHPDPFMVGEKSCYRDPDATQPSSPLSPGQASTGGSIMSSLEPLSESKRDAYNQANVSQRQRFQDLVGPSVVDGIQGGKKASNNSYPSEALADKSYRPERTGCSSHRRLNTAHSRLFSNTGSSSTHMPGLPPSSSRRNASTTTLSSVSTVGGEDPKKSAPIKTLSQSNEFGSGQRRGNTSSETGDVCDHYFNNALAASFQLARKDGQYRKFSRLVPLGDGRVLDLNVSGEAILQKKHSSVLRLTCESSCVSGSTAFVNTSANQQYGDSSMHTSQAHGGIGSFCNGSDKMSNAPSISAGVHADPGGQYNSTGNCERKRCSSFDGASVYEGMPLGHDGLSLAHKVRRKQKNDASKHSCVGKLSRERREGTHILSEWPYSSWTNAQPATNEDVENAIAEADTKSSERQLLFEQSEELGLIPSVQIKNGVSPHRVSVGHQLMNYPIAIWKGFLQHEEIQFPTALLDVKSFCRRHKSVSADVQYQDADSEGLQTRHLSVARQPLKMFLSHLKRCSEGLGPVLPVVDDVSVESLETTPCGTSFVGNPFYVPGNHADELDAKGILTTMKRYKSSYKKHLDELYQQIETRKINSRQSFMSSPYVTPEMAVYWNLDEQPKPPIRYCVNVDLDNRREWANELDTMQKHLPSWIWCRDHLDVMRHIRQPVPGMNQPQIYLKTPGAWTGCHEENLRFHSINICHGPDPSEWKAIPEEYAPRLRQLVWEEFEMDIYRKEGCYLPPEEFCQKHGIPVLTGVQYAGDMVCLNGGTLHWVRSFGISVHSSWNIGPWRESTLVSACVRRSINNSLTPPLPSLIPLETLCLDLSREVNSALENVDFSSGSTSQANIHTAVSHLLDCNLTGFRDFVARLLFELASSIEKEACYLSLGKRLLPACQQEPVGSEVFRCQNNRCNAEIFLHYTFCETCARCTEVGENGVQSYVAPAPGRTDGPIEVHSQFCVPSLEALPSSGSKRRMEHAEGTETCDAFCSDEKRTDAFLRRRLKQHKRRKLNEGKHHICSPIMCVPCGLTHASQIQGQHTIHFYKKEELTDICDTYCHLLRLWDRVSRNLASSSNILNR